MITKKQQQNTVEKGEKRKTDTCIDANLKKKI
jgi:hypothetical protein